MSEDTAIKQSDPLFDQGDRARLANNALTGVMGGVGLGGTLGLIYMISEALKDKERAKDKQKEVKDLSPFLPTTAVATQTKASNDPGFLENLKNTVVEGVQDFGRGAVMVPAVAGATIIPSYLAYKFLKDRFSASRTNQLERELESAREEFRQALSGGSKLSQDISDVIDKTKQAQQAQTPVNYNPTPIKARPDGAKGFMDTVGGYPGLVGGGVSLTGLLAAYLAYKTIDDIKAKKTPKTRATRAMKELQQRRTALSEIAPYIQIERSPSGELYPSL